MTRDRETARRIAQEVQRLGGSVYYVGGCVRDRLLGRESFTSENPEFDRRFNVRCENLTAGQSLLSPRVMDQLLKMGSVYLSVKADGRVFAAIQTDELLFDAGKGRPEGLTQRFADQLRVFTDLLDAMKR